MQRLVLLRHGESVWNRENRFTGWTDVALSAKGQEEALTAAKLLQAEAFVFDQAFTSLLERAIKTLWIVLEEMKLMWIPIRAAWQLNERHYGTLQGLNKKEMSDQYGPEQVHIWRRSFTTSPPALSQEDERYPGNDPRYADLGPAELPLAESLKDTVHRVLPFWESEIVPSLKAGKRLILAAHGNSLRALVKHLDRISDEDISELNIPTGIPLVYELDDQLRPLRHYYLGDAKEAERAVAKVTEQTRSLHA